MRIGSLFSGYGGLDSGVQMVLGGSTAWHSEIEPAACRILEHRFPGVPNLGDVTKVDWSQVEPVDVVTGGFPCQPFSGAGKRKRHEDDRYLWHEFVRAIAWLQPQLVVIENVAGLMYGGTVDAPDYRCACGWHRGWRRKHHHLQTSHGHIRSPGGRRNDGSWSSDAPASPVSIRGDTEGGGPVDPGMGFDLALATTWATDVGFSDASSAVSAGQAGTGPSGTPAGGDPSWTPQGGQKGSLDGPSQSQGRDDPSSDARAESSGSEAPVDDNETTVCPACGRDLGRAPRRPVFRSGFTDVLGDLAALGFHVRWCTVRAADAGAPHGRARVFVFAWPSDADRSGLEGREPARRHVVSARGASADAAELGCGAEGRDDGLRAEGLVAWDGEGPAIADADSDGLRGGQEPHSDPLGDGEDGGDRRHADRLGVAARGALDWGAYGPAIRRWETVLRRPAPAPTERNWDRWRRARDRRFSSRKPIGFRGSLRPFTQPPSPRLSPSFVEWLMGLPEGWVTDVPGVNRNAQLKVLGNGVVPQQCALALQLFLKSRTLEVAA